VRRGGFSLLEVILALAILGGAVAVLGEAARLALTNAEFTRDMAHAQMLCESKLAEITAGMTTAEPVHRAVLEKPDDAGGPGWLYSVERTPLDEDGLVSVCVTIVRDLPKERHPVSFSLVRWIVESSAASQTSSDQDTASQNTSGETAAPGGSQ
jgi:prepilin-type N-terminal cleavage/methylation domain-containing protein